MSPFGLAVGTPQTGLGFLKSKIKQTGDATVIPYTPILNPCQQRRDIPQPNLTALIAIIQ